MKLFKRSEKTGAPYYVRYWERRKNGRSRQRCVSTGSSEFSIAKQAAAKILSDASLRFHGIIDPDLERYQKEANRTIEEHLTDFLPRLETRYTGTKARINIVGQLNYIRGFASFEDLKTIGEINADSMNRYIVHLADAGKSARTIGAMIGACKHFTSWLRKHGKLRTDPLETIEKPDPDSDRRLNRRMLLPTEWEWLIKATLKAGDRYGMTATERCLAYRVAIQTGLRVGELRSLKRGSFNLDDKTPYVKADSGTTKNRQTAYQYIDVDLASDLKGLLATKLPSATVFDLPTKEAAKMLQADLNDARTMWLSEVNKNPTERAKREESYFLKPTNEAGDALDFHSLRHTCGAWLAIRGTQPKVIQSVMRHSTITLTMDTYGHLLEGAQAAAITHAADLTAIPNIFKATGTDPKLALHVLRSSVLGSFSAGANRRKTEGETDAADVATVKRKNRKNPREFAVSCVGESAEDKGFEPSTGFPAPDFESGSDLQKTNKNKGLSKPGAHVLTSAIPADLKSVVDAWPNLSESTKQTLLNLIELDRFNQQSERTGTPPTHSEPVTRQPSRKPSNARQ